MNGPFSFAADRPVKLGKSRGIRRHNTGQGDPMTIDRTRNALPLPGWVMSLSLLLLTAPALAGIDDRDGTAEELARVRTALEARGYATSTISSGKATTSRSTLAMPRIAR